MKTWKQEGDCSHFPLQMGETRGGRNEVLVQGHLGKLTAARGCLSSGELRPPPGAQAAAWALPACQAGVERAGRLGPITQGGEVHVAPAAASRGTLPGSGLGLGGGRLGGPA